MPILANHMESAMLKITVVSPKVTERRGPTKDGKSTYHLRIQDTYFHFSNREGELDAFPSKVEVLLDTLRVDEKSGEILTPEQPAYGPGEYTLHPSAVYLDRKTGRLAISPRLTPLAKRTA
jgi:hypothetical protein